MESFLCDILSNLDPVIINLITRLNNCLVGSLLERLAGKTFRQLKDQFFCWFVDEQLDKPNEWSFSEGQSINLGHQQKNSDLALCKLCSTREKEGKPWCRKIPSRNRRYRGNEDVKLDEVNLHP